MRDEMEKLRTYEKLRIYEGLPVLPRTFLEFWVSQNAQLQTNYKKVIK